MSGSVLSGLHTSLYFMFAVNPEHWGSSQHIYTGPKRAQRLICLDAAAWDLSSDRLSPKVSHSHCPAGVFFSGPASSLLHGTAEVGHVTVYRAFDFWADDARTKALVEWALPQAGPWQSGSYYSGSCLIPSLVFQVSLQFCDRSEYPMYWVCPKPFSQCSMYRSYAELQTETAKISE